MARRDLWPAARRFRKAVAGLELWLRTDFPSELAAAHAALRTLAALYSAGLDLPSYGKPATKRRAAAASVSDEEWRGVLRCATKLPFQYYSELFDPHKIPPEEPVTGNIADDLADIYRDVVVGARLFDAGDQAGALWQWVFHLAIHWGEHATSAMRALQQHLADSDIELSRYEV
jgi:Domain of unknown function (DUF5063)